MPANRELGRCLAARVEGRSSVARCGVLVHFTAPTIHPGFRRHDHTGDHQPRPRPVHAPAGHADRPTPRRGSGRHPVREGRPPVQGAALAAGADPVNSDSASDCCAGEGIACEGIGVVLGEVDVVPGSCRRRRGGGSGRGSRRPTRSSCTPRPGRPADHAPCPEQTARPGRLAEGEQGPGRRARRPSRPGRGRPGRRSDRRDQAQRPDRPGQTPRGRRTGRTAG